VNPWHWLLDTLRWGLTEFHDLFLPIFGEHSWGWAIIALTLVIRVFLLPLAAKQFKSMRAMQALNPEMQKIRKKYKVDRDLMKKDPEKYKAQRQKMNEEVMGLYQEHGVNPAASCLPLLLQAPIFFALFRILWAEGERIDAMVGAPFYVFSPLDQAANASIWGWILVVGMAATMFITQRQMMGANPATEGIQATQQKVMLYGMPVFLGVVAQGLPKGVLVYWVTTNLWQLIQQQLILRQIKQDDAAKEGAKKGGAGATPGAKSGKPAGKKGGDSGSKGTKAKSDGAAKKSTPRQTTAASPASTGTWPTREPTSPVPAPIAELQIGHWR
jgi:YidC/Oxa1 family membrane protein insertase